MKTAEEIWQEFNNSYEVVCELDVHEAMKAYAKQVAEQALKDAAENAKVGFINDEFGSKMVVVNGSILSTPIQLP